MFLSMQYLSIAARGKEILAAWLYTFLHCMFPAWEKDALKHHLYLVSHWLAMGLRSGCNFNLHWNRKTEFPVLHPAQDRTMVDFILLTPCHIPACPMGQNCRHKSQWPGSGPGGLGSRLRCFSWFHAPQSRSVSKVSLPCPKTPLSYLHTTLPSPSLVHMLAYPGWHQPSFFRYRYRSSIAKPAYALA